MREAQGSISSTRKEERERGKGRPVQSQRKGKEKKEVERQEAIREGRNIFGDGACYAVLKQTSVHKDRNFTVLFQIEVC